MELVYGNPMSWSLIRVTAASLAGLLLPPRIPQAQNEPNTEPSPITAARAMIGPIIAAITMSK
jgi:hypothetical protein